MTEKNPLCPVCANECFMGYGPKDSLALVITDEPEIGEKAPLSPAMQALRDELSREGLDLLAMRYVPLYRHPKLNSCKEEHSRWLFEEIIQHQIILACGVEICKMLVGETPLNVCGLRMKSPLLSEDRVLICSVNPAIVVSRDGTVGELRLAVRKFAAEYKILEKTWKQTS